MNLYIVRHAIAIPHGTPGIQEDDRTLTKEGIKKMQQVATGLRTLGYIPDLILSSPLIRASHTAEILLEAFGKRVENENRSGAGSRRQPSGVVSPNCPVCEEA